MNQALRTYLDERARSVDEDVRQALDACGGDAVSALRTALIANALLIEENQKLKKNTSAGFLRLKPPPPGKKD